jgi:hypothetical protein
MNGDDPIRAMWRKQPTTEMPEMSAEQLHKKSDQLARKVTSRKWVETVAGGVGLVAFAVLGVRWRETPLLLFACALLVLGEAVVILGMWRRSVVTPAPVSATTADFLAHYRAELGHERDRLWTVPIWYLGPIAPGLAVFPFAVCVSAGLPWGWVCATWLPSLVLTCAIIAYLNRRVARRIAREIESLGGSAS